MGVSKDHICAQARLAARLGRYTTVSKLVGAHAGVAIHEAAEALDQAKQAQEDSCFAAAAC